MYEFFKTNKNEDFSRHLFSQFSVTFLSAGNFQSFPITFLSDYTSCILCLFTLTDSFSNADKLHLAFLMLHELPTKTTQQIFNHQVNISSFHPSSSLVINETQVNVSSCCEWIKHFANKVGARVIYGFSDEKINFHLGCLAFSNVKWGKKEKAPLWQ